MCGIVGYVGSKKAAPIIVEGLRKLEYRGYDSAGIAIHDGKGIEIVPDARQADQAQRGAREADARRRRPASATRGGRRTAARARGTPTRTPRARWPSCTTASSRTTWPSGSSWRARGQVPLRHGHRDRRSPRPPRAQKGAKSLFEAVRGALRQVHGALRRSRSVSRDEPDVIVAARYGSPLVVGAGENEMLCGSDIPALLAHTRDMIFLEDGDIVELRASGVRIETVTGGEKVERRVKRIDWSPVQAERGGYKHFMLKEIHEQPDVVEASAARQDRSRRRRRSRDRDGGHARVREGAAPGLHRRVRHQPPRRHRRALLDRAARQGPHGRRARERGPLPRADLLPRRSRDRHQPVGRDRRHDRGAVKAQGAGRQGAGALQRASTARSRASPTARSTRTRAPRSASPRPRPSPRSSPRCSCSRVYLGRRRDSLLGGARARDPPGPLGDPEPHARGARRRRLRARDREAPRPREGRPVPRARPRLPHRARGRAQAEGDLVRARRGLRGRRDEARADRPHRRGAPRHRRLPRATRTTRRRSPTCRRSGRARAGRRDRHEGRRVDPARSPSTTSGSPGGRTRSCRCSPCSCSSSSPITSPT